MKTGKETSQHVGKSKVALAVKHKKANSKDFNKLELNNTHHGLPWWPSGYESACQCRGHGLEPWSRKIPHAVEQLSPCATTTEPVF